jgi:predicted SAM-dependent methyltransferase
MFLTSRENIAYPRVWLKSRKQVSSKIDSLLSFLRANSLNGLHLGAGQTRLPHLVNCDLYNPAADARVDALNLSGYTSGSIDYIESHHMIEHLSFAETHRALAEWHRVLCKGGLLVITFPDLTAIAIEWIKHSLLYPFSQRQDDLEYIVKMLVGSQEHDGMFHRNAFDFRLMNKLLLTHGLKTEFTYYRYPKRTTPSRIVIAKKL